MEAGQGTTGDGDEPEREELAGKGGAGYEQEPHRQHRSGESVRREPQSQFGARQGKDRGSGRGLGGESSGDDGQDQHDADQGGPAADGTQFVPGR